MPLIQPRTRSVDAAARLAAVTMAPPAQWSPGADPEQAGGTAPHPGPWSAAVPVPPDPPPSGRAPSWLPERLRTAQLVAPRQAVAGLLAAAILAAVVTAGVLWWARPRASAAVEPPRVLAPGATTPSRAPIVPGTTATALVVSVVGKVRHPGLVRLPAGSRVADALKAAGGPVPGVDLTPLNLARKVTDGEQVVVGAPAPPVGSTIPDPGTPDATGTPVNLNTATLADLDALPGVGPVIAQRILDYRAEHGPFASVDQLADVSGIGDATLEHLRPLVTV